MRLFIAIDFNELKDYFDEIQKKINVNLVKLKFTSSHHLTLKFLGEVAEDKVDLIKEKLKEVSFQPFSLSLDKIGVFPSENYIRIIWIGVKPHEEVKGLQKNIENALSEFRKDMKFHPHITLARVRFVKEKDRLVKGLKEIKIAEKTVKVDNFKLIKSNLTREGPVYEDISVFKD